MRKFLLLTLTAIMLFGIFAVGQDDKILRANVPFEFVVGTKIMPAGTYEVRVTDNTRIVQLKNLKTNDVAMLEVMTRLAPDSSRTHSTLTFDVLGAKHTLETYWPKVDDGFLLHTTPIKHTHKIVMVG